MSGVDGKVRAAQRRLWLSRWVGQLGWSLLIAAGCWMLIGVGDRLFSLDIPLRIVAIVLAGAAVLTSAGWWLLTRDSRYIAAATLDEAAELRERLSTSLYCESRDDPWSQAVQADAANSLDRIIMRQHVPVRWPRSGSYAISSILLATLVVWLTPKADLFGREAERRAEAERKEQVERIGATVQQAVEKVKAVSALDKVGSDLKELEALTNLDPKELREAKINPEDMRRQAVKRLEDAANAIKRRLASGQYESSQQFRRMMRALKDPGQANDPVSELQRALAKGDLKGGQDAIRELQDELAKADELSPEQREAIQEKLQELAEKLNELAKDDTFEQKLESLKLDEQQLEKLAEAVKNADQLTEQQKEELEKQLAEKGLTQEQIEQIAQEMEQRRQARQQCQGLASKLGSAASAMGQAGQEGSLGESAMGQLDAAGQMLSELELLDQQLGDLNSALNELNQCQGGLCEGWGDEYTPGETGAGMGQIGRGEGGRAPREEGRVGLKERRAPVQTGQGKIIGRWFVEGQQLKGESKAELTEAVNAATTTASEALQEDRIPRRYQRAVKTYFDRLSGYAPPPEEKEPDSSADPSAEASESTP